MAQLMYGSGLRLMELLRLRVQDVNFEQGILTVCSGIGHADVATTMIYTHVLNRPGLAVRSPPDSL
jgi:site-specific recombinase XerD